MTIIPWLRKAALATVAATTLLALFGWGTTLAAVEPTANSGRLPARSAPPWLTRGVIYQVWLRSFTSEGTLRAAEKRLASVADLGATVIYLGPVCLQDADMRQEFWSVRQKASGTNNPRNPYRIADYNRIDPEYGTDADLRSFIATAHKLNLRVLIDLVYFHCGPTSVLVEQPDFIVRDASGKPLTGEWHFPRLNFASPRLREYLWANMEQWVKDFDADGFRCDVADAVPLDFWEEARRRLDRLRPDLVILAEGQRKADQLKAFDLNYNFDWHRAALAVVRSGQPASSLRALWQKMADVRPRGARFIRYTENHDIVNDMERAEVVCGERGAAALAVVHFTLDGVPLLYNGQEIGDTSPQSIFARWPVAWQTACLPKPQAKYAFFRKLCQLRRTEPALTTSDVVWLNHNQPDTVLAFLRSTSREWIVAVTNLSNRKIDVQIELPRGAPTPFAPLLVDRAGATVIDKKLSVKLDGFGYFVGKHELQHKAPESSP
jgi:glycosidase